MLERRNYILKKNSAMTESKQTRLKRQMKCHTTSVVTEDLIFGCEIDDNTFLYQVMKCVIVFGCETDGNTFLYFSYEI